MNRSLAVRAALALFAATGLAPAQSVSQLLARLDRAAATFKGAKADLRRTSYTASINVTEEESGSTVIRRAGPGKLEFRIDITGANANTWVIRDQTAEHYLPAMNQREPWDIRKYRDLAQTLLVLGFGMSGRELAASYTVSNPRRDTVAGRAATAVDLAPKSQDAIEKLHLKKVELWVADDTAAPAREKFYFTDGNTWTVEYFNVQMNPKLPASALDLPKGAKRVKMQ
jgi:outer membrane lipoprotein-sorting protein